MGERRVKTQSKDSAPNNGVLDASRAEVHHPDPRALSRFARNFRNNFPLFQRLGATFALHNKSSRYEQEFRAAITSATTNEARWAAESEAEFEMDACRLALEDMDHLEGEIRRAGQIWRRAHAAS